MGDDGYSASELRRRYNKGGTLQDNDLSAAQLRARHNVKGRGNAFSSSPSLFHVLKIRF